MKIHQVRAIKLFGLYNKGKNKISEKGVNQIFSLKLLLLLFLSLGSMHAKAQVVTYDFVYDDVTYTAFWDGQVLGNQTNDDVPFQNINIGFDFIYNGNMRNIVSISPNGYISLNNSNSQTTAPISNLNNVISAFGADIKAQKIESRLSYKTTGSAPERVFRVQWSEYVAKHDAINNVNYNFSFQINLYETSNRIEIIYGKVVLYPFVPDVHVQVGLRGNNAGDFSNRVTDSNDNWKNTSEGNNKDATCPVINLVTYVRGPSLGMRYTYTPSTGMTPIELYSFSGAFDKNTIKLKWSTLTEINNAYFEIERSVNGVAFNVIGEVEGSGSSSQLVDYAYTDHHVWEDGYYYRLKQVDYNGSSEYFNFIYVESPGNQENLALSVYPNPSTNNNINFTFNSPDKVTPVSLVLFSIDGKVLFSKTYNRNELSSTVALERLPKLFPRTYYLKVIQGQYSAIEQIIIIP